MNIWRMPGPQVWHGIYRDYDYERVSDALVQAFEKPSEGWDWVGPCPTPKRPDFLQHYTRYPVPDDSETGKGSLREP